MSTDAEIVKDFINDSKNLVHMMMVLLEQVELDFPKTGDMTLLKKGKDYARIGERVTSRAKSLAMMEKSDHAFHLIANYSELCRQVALKWSEVSKNKELAKVCLAFLLDATETLGYLLQNLDKKAVDLKKHISNTFIERLQWIQHQLAQEESDRLGRGEAKLGQDDIDDLMSKLGL